MNIARTLTSLGLVVASAGCVDSIDFNLDRIPGRIVIDGFITTDPPPYKIKVSESTNIADPLNIDKKRTLKYLLLMDDIGHVDTLREPDRTIGTFYTPEDGIRGTPGRAYKIKFETVDGREYESVFDTLLAASGGIDTLYHDFKRKVDLEGRAFYGFDIRFSASDPEKNNLHFWQLVTTYQVETDPKNHRKQCGPDPTDPDCPPGVNCGCRDPLECSGYVLVPGDTRPQLQYEKPCVCCTCWVTETNNSPIIQDFNINGPRSRDILADFIALTPYNFMFKAHVRLDQYTASTASYNFFKAILAQQEGKGSLFQPVTGKLPGNIVQLSGKSIPAEGIFYATSKISRSMFIERRDIPKQEVIPAWEPYPFANKKVLGSCLLEFPVSTTERPSFWQ